MGNNVYFSTTDIKADWFSTKGSFGGSELFLDLRSNTNRSPVTEEIPLTHCLGGYKFSLHKKLDLLHDASFVYSS